MGAWIRFAGLRYGIPPPVVSALAVQRDYEIRQERMDIKQLLQQGFEKAQGEHADAEKLKVGILRGGNSGLAEEIDGVTQGITGHCHRKTYLRLKGINWDATDDDRLIMFEGGRYNEDVWFSILSKSYPYRILREEEVPISWKTKNGTLVTGRPDMVLCDAKGKPQLGLELKMASSLWTVREIINGRPKQPHLIQAGHYSWQLDVPFQLWYTSYVDFAVTGWVAKHFPAAGEPGSAHCVYNDQGEIVKVLPFQVGFELKWDSDGVLHFRKAGTQDRWQDTIVSKARIERYYEFVSSMEANNELGPRPENLKWDGNKQSWSMCDAKYCKLASVCDRHESSGLRAWTKVVQELASMPTEETTSGDVAESEAPF